MTRGMLAVACFPLTLSLAPSDYGRLNAGEALVEVVPANGPNIAVRAATKIEIGGSRLIMWTRHVDRSRAGPYMSSAGRFADPPRIEDLDGLSLDDDDLSDLRECRPANCGLKLDAAEITRLRQVIAAAGPTWRAAAQVGFRGVVLARAERYLGEGHTPASVYHDQKKRVLLDGEFAALASELALTHPQLSPLTKYLALYPRADAEDVESFLYWSKDSLGAKPIVSVTHVAMIQSRDPNVPEAVVARKQVYASHYITASLSLTVVTLAPDRNRRYLVYLNHTRADVFHGLFGGLIRGVVERRLRAEGPGALQALRDRLESGEPDRAR